MRWRTQACRKFHWQCAIVQDSLWRSGGEHHNGSSLSAFGLPGTLLYHQLCQCAICARQRPAGGTGPTVHNILVLLALLAKN